MLQPAFSVVVVVVANVPGMAGALGTRPAPQAVTDDLFGQYIHPAFLAQGGFVLTVNTIAGWVGWLPTRRVGLGKGMEAIALGSVGDLVVYGQVYERCHHYAVVFLSCCIS